MASTALNHSFLALPQQIEILKDEIKKQVETLDRLKREQHETADATRHLDSLVQRYAALVVAAL